MDILVVAGIIAVFTLFLLGLAAMSEQAVKWWEWRRHVTSAIALTKDD